MTTGDCVATKAVGCRAPTGGGHEPIKAKGDNEVVQPGHPESLSVVSESDYRCLEESAEGSMGSARYVIRNLVCED